MALTLRLNGSGAQNLVTASWWNDYYNLLTGVMADQPVKLLPTLTLQAIGGAAAAPTPTAAAGTSLGIGVYGYGVSFVTADGGESGVLITSAGVTTTTNNQNVNLTSIPTGPTGTVKRKIYRTLVNGAPPHLYLVTTLNDNTTTTYSDTTSDANLGASAPIHPNFGGALFLRDQNGNLTFLLTNDGTVQGGLGLKAIGKAPATAPSAALQAGTNLGTGVYKYVVTFISGSGYAIGESLQSPSVTITTTTGNQQVSLTSIPLGPVGTFSRNIYRTAVGGSSFLYVTTIYDNTTTTYVDSKADGSLGGGAPAHPSFGGSLIIKDADENVKAQIFGDGAISFDSANITSDGTGNLTITNGLIFGGGAFVTYGSLILSLSAPWSGSANGIAFKHWNGSATKTPFSVGGQFAGAAAYVDDTGTFFGLLQMIRNGTKGGYQIFTGTNTPSGQNTGDIWIQG